MTPKELLQQQRRQQVDFNLQLPGITSREIQAGQYSVAVQRTKPAEQTTVGRLAEALGSINPIIAKYGEAQIAETELQILGVQQKLAGMSPEEKNKLMQAPDAEARLSRSFREDYELNPVATFRAKMLLGAEKNPEFKALLAERLEEFKLERIRENGDKPSYIDVSDEIDRFTKDYIDQAGLNTEGKASMRLGFLQEASPYINKLKQALPAEFAEIHKQEITMPNLASRLARSYEEEEGLESLKNNWDAYSSSLSRNEQLQVIDAALGILNFDSSVEDLESGIAFLEDMRLAGIKVGNQALDADGNSPMSDSYYINKIDDLEDMREAVDRRQKANASSRAFELKLEVKEVAEANATNGISEDDPRFQKYIDNVKEQIKQDPNNKPFERNAKLAAVDEGVNDGYKQQNEDIDELERSANSGGSTIATASVGSEIRSYLINTVMDGLENRTLLAEDVQDALIVSERATGDVTDLSHPLFNTLSIGPGLRSMAVELNSKYANILDEAVLELVNAKRGEEFKLPGSDALYVIGEDENISNRRRDILAKHMAGLIPGLMDSAKEKLDDIIESAKQDRKDAASAEVEEQKRLEDIETKEGKTARSEELIKIGPPASGKIGAGLARRGQKGKKMKRLSGAGIESDPETVVNMPKFLDSLEHTFRYNPYTPEQTQIIKEDAEAIYTEATPGIKAKLKEALEFSKKSRTSKIKAEREAKYINLSEQVFRARRLFKGYTPEEVKKALSVGKGEPGYLPEFARIPDPKSFFRTELLGEERAAALLKDATDEDVAEIAKRLDVDAETLKKRQEQYKQASEGKVPKVEAPAEPPVVEPSVETPAPEPVKKERKPIVTLEDIRKKEEERKQRKDAEEQLELPLDTPGRMTIDTTKTSIKKPIIDLKSDFEDLGNQYGVDPSFLMAISALETGHGSSSAFRNKNNAMGVTPEKGVASFKTKRASIERMAKLLASPKGPYRNATTIAEIGKEYSPVGEDVKNDPKGTNKFWIPTVTKFVQQLKGTEDVSSLPMIFRKKDK